MLGVVIEIIPVQSMMGTGIFGKNQNSGSYEQEPELTFVDLVPVEQELELYQDILVLVIRTRTVRPKLR